MRTYALLARLSIVTMSMCSLIISAQSRERIVRSVEIDSRWSGLGVASKSLLVIRNNNGEFALDGRPVDAALVRALVVALNEPVSPKPTLESVGLTPEWLSTTAREMAQRQNAYFSSATGQQKELFVRTFSDPSAMNRMLGSVFGGIRTDDYPRLAVTVTFDGGATLGAESTSQHIFMLPWKLSQDGALSYNALISRALYALMPMRTVNRQRLSGGQLESMLFAAVMDSIRDEWRRLDND